MNIDFATLYLISVPGFLIGLMTGRFVSSHRWTTIRKKTGVAGKWLGGLAFLAYVSGSLVTLGVMTIYVANLPTSSPAIKYWLTLLWIFWIVLNLGLELWDMIRRKRAGKIMA